VEVIFGFSMMRAMPRLEIPVDDAGCVGVTQRDEQPVEHEQARLGEIEDVLLAVARQGHARHELGDDVRVLGVGAGVVVDLGDQRVLQAGDGAGLGLDALLGLQLLGQMRVQQLEGDDAVQRGIVGLEHDGHAAASDLFDDPVLADLLDGHSAPRVTRAPIVLLL